MRKIINLSFFLILFTFVSCKKSDVITKKSYDDFDFLCLKPSNSKKAEKYFYVDIFTREKKTVAVNFIDLYGKIIKHDTVIYKNNKQYFLDFREVYKNGYPHKVSLYTLKYIDKSCLNRQFLVKIKDKFYLLCYDIFNTYGNSFTRAKMTYESVNIFKYNSIDDYLSHPIKEIKKHSFQNKTEFTFYYSEEDVLNYSKVIQYGKRTISDSDYTELRACKGNLYLDLDRLDFENNVDSLKITNNIVVDLLDYFPEKQSNKSR